MKKVFLMALLAISVFGCRKKESGTRVTYTVTGVIQAISPNREEIIIRHNRIPGYMDNMTMPFKVKEASLLDGFKPGQAVMFQLAVTRDDAVIEGLTPAPETNTTEDENGNRPADNAQWIHIPKIGEPIPDIVLTNQDGHRVHLQKERGKVLALNFIYSRCPLPTYCPRSMREFGSVKKTLGDSMGKDVELFTVTFDPQNDTPGVLKTYAAPYGAATPDWQMLTGHAEEVKKAVSFFDVNYWTSRTGKIQEHTMSVVIVDKHGKIAQFYTGNNYTADQLVKEIRDLLALQG